jgi:enoyl-CoA hydratase/carnithine racemase
MWRGLADACTALDGDRAVRVLVVRGTGGHFSAGADIGGFGAGPTVEYREAVADADHALADFPKPTVAFVTGSCVGGGAQIAIACDLRLADTTARLGITPARLGILYPGFAVERAVRLIGPSATKHLLYSAEIVDAARARQIGLVDEVHEPEAAEARLVELSAALTSRSLFTQMASKAMVDAVSTGGRVPAEVEQHWVAQVGDDAQEGVAAFLEGRDARFSWDGPATG